jgi:hypothetical protein
MMRNTILFAIFIFVSAYGFCEGSKEQKVKPELDSFLYSGGLAKGEEALAGFLKSDPRDDQARFELGIVYFIRSIERFAQTVYRFGPTTRSQFIPFFSLPVPENKNPETVTYEKFRTMLATFEKDMNKVIEILEPIGEKNVSVPLFIGKVKLDIDSSKKFSDWETLWVMYAKLNRNVKMTQKDAESFLVKLDLADALWLAGYCHLLAATADILLSYDFRKLFEIVAPYAFAKTDFEEHDLSDEESLSDILTFRVIDKAKKRLAVDHVLACFDSSRKCFDAAGKEKDDDREWIPNSKQKSVIPGVGVSDEMIEYWRRFLTEAETIVLGKKLVPLYMSDINGTKGVNINKMLLDEKPLAISAMLKTGTVPWIESGTLTDYEFWNELMRVFGGEFIGFAIWFN